MARQVLGGTVAAGVLSMLTPATVTAQLDALAAAVRAAEALGATTGCVVVTGDGRALFQQHAERTFAPASNQKLITAIAALAELGPDHRFVTRFGLRAGRLVVRGGGDPNWQTGGPHDPAAVFGEVAAGLRERGVVAIRGIDLEAGPFEGPERPPTWPSDQFDNYYCPPTGGLVLDAGCFRARITATGGSNAQIDVTAPFPMPIEGNLRMTDDRRRGGLYGITDTGGELRAQGHFYRKSGPREVVGAVRDPVGLYRRALERGLRAGGIELDPAAPAADGPVMTYETTLREALEPMLVDSSNFHAEQVLRVLGVETQGLGSFAGGIVAVRSAMLDLLGELPADWRVLDGSGLSRDNAVSPALIATALSVAARQPWGEVLLAALPTPGEGSMASRFSNSHVRDSVAAKTGWIRGASSLAGVVGNRCFAILMNYDPKVNGLNNKLKRIQEQMVEAIAGIEDA